MKTEEGEEPGVLYVVATPIGNLEDITRRAVRILSEVSLIAAEDTRHTRKLLSSLNISTRMISYYKGQEFSRAAKVIDKLRMGDNVALVSDAGTPAISDPGAILVRQVVAAGIKVEPIPGASALTASVSVAGLADTPFSFLGFLPGKKGDRKRLLQSLFGSGMALVYYESPRRIIASLRECLGLLGDRQVFLGRELTKLHEELFHSTISETIAELESRSNIRGEFVVIIEGQSRDKEDQPSGDLQEVLTWYRDHSGLSMRDACRQISADLGLSRSEIYNQALKIWN